MCPSSGTGQIEVPYPLELKTASHRSFPLQEGFEVQLLGPPDVKEQAERHGMTFVETWPMSSKEIDSTRRGSY